MKVCSTNSGCAWAHLLLVGTSLLFPLPETAAQDALSVADRQSVDAFISIEDGQPGDPGNWELSLKFGWEKVRLREPEGEWELKYTGKGGRFRENLKLSIVQSAELSGWDADGNGDIELNWQQRWREESGNIPTLASRLTLSLPTGRGQTGYGLTLTGILIKDVGPGALYLNASGTVPFDVDDSDVRDFLWSASLGYKWRVSNRFSLYSNYVIQSSQERGRKESNTLEFAAQFNVHERITIGPGIEIGLNNRAETPEFGAGVKFTIGL